MIIQISEKLAYDLYDTTSFLSGIDVKKINPFIEQFCLQIRLIEVIAGHSLYAIYQHHSFTTYRLKKVKRFKRRYPFKADKNIVYLLYNV